MTPGTLQSTTTVSSVELLPLHSGASHGSLLASPRWLLVVALVAAGLTYVRLQGHLSRLRLVGVGIGVAIGGYVGDALWHANHAADGGSALPPPHLLILLGAVAGLAGAVETARDAGRATAAVTAVAALAAAGMVLGELWIDVSLAMGLGEPDSGVPLAVVNVGFLVLVLGALVALLLEKRGRIAGVVGS